MNSIPISTRTDSRTVSRQTGSRHCASVANRSCPLSVFTLGKPVSCGHCLGVGSRRSRVPSPPPFRALLSPNVAALISVLTVTVVLLAPGAFLLQRFFDEAIAGFRLIRRDLDPAVLPSLAERYPYLATVLHWLQARFDLNQETKRLAALLAGRAPAVISGSVQVITQSAMMLVTLFYFLRDRRMLLDFLLRIAPLSSSECQELVN